MTEKADQLPLWVAPNVITMVGTSLLILMCVTASACDVVACLFGLGLHTSSGTGARCSSHATVGALDLMLGAPGCPTMLKFIGSGDDVSLV
jgi:hypothetical protein